MTRTVLSIYMYWLNLSVMTAFIGDAGIIKYEHQQCGTDIIQQYSANDTTMIADFIRVYFLPIIYNKMTNMLFR